MRICSTRSTRSSITKSAKRVLLVLCYLATWAVVPLVAVWRAGTDPPAMALFLSVQTGNLAAIDEALRDGVHVDSRDVTGITPLMAAARAGHIDVMRKLLVSGASIDVCVPVFGTPLMVAATNRQHDVMRELVERGANVDAVNPTGQTALWIARTGGDEEAVRILTEAGAIAEGHCTAPDD